MLNKKTVLISLDRDELQSLMIECFNSCLKYLPTSTKNPEVDFLTVKEAADFLNLSAPTIYSKVSRGELPYMKRGKRLYFSKNELISYLKSGRVKTLRDISPTSANFLVKR